MHRVCVAGYPQRGSNTGFTAIYDLRKSNTKLFTVAAEYAGLHASLCANVLVVSGAGNVGKGTWGSIFDLTKSTPDSKGIISNPAKEVFIILFA